MIFYFVAFFILLLFPLKRKQYCIVVTGLLILLAGLRSNLVGTDTEQYEEMFSIISKMSFEETLVYWYAVETSSEIGFHYLINFVGRFFDYHFFKFLCAIITISPVGYIIYKYSDHPVISFFVFYTLPIYPLLSMSAMRQGIAFGLIMIAFDRMMKNKFLSFTILIAIALLFHSSAIFFFPFYFINKLPYKRNYNNIILIGIGVIAVFSLAIFQFLNQYSRIDYEAGEAGGIGMLLFLFIMFLASLLIPQKSLCVNPNKIYFFMLVGTMMFWVIGMNLAAIFRLAAYTEFFLCLYISNSLFKIRKENIKHYAVTFACIMCFIMMARLTVREDPDGYNGYYPYYFNWEINK